jgi:hypothetical protein
VRRSARLQQKRHKKAGNCACTFCRV